ncbi:MAG TPA: quinone-dependent dihydroorotate dehydrogenase [Candidatus Binataceae bacterium]|jgi:dihydroorotate dehydrogenase|nr:quinone-dependent dihydroorotate dehydrogenase [Candidatus Binataceae bacterium]
MAPFLDLVWRRALRPLFFILDAELAHRMVLTLLAGVPALSASPDAQALGQDLWGMRFSNPLGLAAGLDKDAAAVAAWQMLGFGFAEVGTITLRPQPGNPRPRLWRLPEHRALINRLGFPSLGMDVAGRRLERLRGRGLRLRLGVNIGPNKETPPERVADEIAAAAARLGSMADFIVVNVSSPNTPGLREWQAPGHLRALIARAFPERIGSAEGAQANRPPVLVKVAPDLDSDQLRAICATILDLRLDGIVATNTTIAREAVGVRSDFPGGLSGQPLKARARELIGEIYRYTEARIPIIGVGGVASAQDAYGHICAGASLVELYTGLIYEGPGLPAAIKDGLSALMRRDGYRSIAEAIGKSISEPRV